MASISSWLSAGTITISCCAGVTTPPTVWTASCCTTPSTGAVSCCRLVRCSALITSWARPAAFCSALASSSSRPCVVLGDGLAARLLQGRDGRIAFAQPALLDQELLLLADQVLQFLRDRSACEPSSLPNMMLADVDPLLQQRDRRLELVDRWPRWSRARPPSARSGGRVAASLACCSATWLASSCRCISISGRGASAGGLNSASGSSLGQRRAQPGHVELRRHQIALQVVALGGVHGRIELDQHVARLDALAVAHMDRAHDAGLERLDDLGAAGRDDLAGRGGDDVDRAEARPGERGGRTPR